MSFKGFYLSLSFIKGYFLWINDSAAHEIVNLVDNSGGVIYTVIIMIIGNFISS